MAAHDLDNAPASKKTTTAASLQTGTATIKPQTPVKETVMNKAQGPLALQQLVSRGVSRSGGSEIVAKYVKNLAERMKAIELGNEFEVLAFDGAQHLVHYSAVLFCCKKAVSAKALNVAVHVLLLEQSGTRQQPKQISVGGQAVEMQVVPSDVVNAKYWGKVAAFVTQRLGGNVSVLSAGMNVIHDEVNADNEGLINGLIYHSVNATAGVMNTVIQTEEPITAAAIASLGLQMNVRSDFNPPVRTTVDGLPVRSDFEIVLQATQPGTDQSDVEQSIEVTSASAYVDLQYVGAPQVQQAMFGQPAPQVVSTQQYKPRLILTDIASQMQAVTPELQLMALSTSILAADNNLWTGVFEDRYIGHHKKSSKDLHDIGAVGYEIAFQPGQPPQAIDTKANTFDQNMRYQFLNSIFQPGLIYSMIVPEAGELSWINSAFTGAAVNQGDGKAQILAAANRLTGGIFGTLFDGNQPIAFDSGRVHCGYFIDENGDRKDIREIDYLAILNLLGAKNPEAIVDWSQTFDATGIPEEIRLEKRWNMLKLVLGDSLKLTGFARLINFNPLFLKALAEAIAAVLPYNKGSLLRGYQAFQRGNAQLANLAYTHQPNTLFVQQTINQQQGGLGSVYLNRF